jgi:hypothetical protein
MSSTNVLRNNNLSKKSISNKNTSSNLLSSNYFSPSSNNNSNGLGISNNSIVNRLNNKYQDNKTIFIIIGVVSLVLVVVGIYYFYHYVKDKNVAISEVKEILDSIQDAQEEMEISAGQIPISKYSNEYGISMWFKIDSYTYRYGQEKVILKRGDEKYGTPEIILAPKDNKLIVRTKLQHPVDEIKPAALNVSESFADVPTKKKESFTGALPNAPQLALLEKMTDVSDIGQMISNNSAPIESKQYQEKYFDLISGNKVNHNIEGFQDAPEGGDNTDSVEDTVVSDDVPKTADTVVITNEYVESELIKLCLAICKLMEDKEMKHMAIKTYKDMDGSLEKIMRSSEDEINNMYATKKSENEEMDSAEGSSNGSRISNINLFSNEVQQYTNANNLFNTLVNLDENNESLNMEEIVNNVNQKLGEMNCEFKLVGNTTEKVVSNTVKAMANILRESLYLLIYQLGENIKNNNPDIMSKLDSVPSYVDECVIDNLPLQKWLNLVVSQYNQSMDIYLDGQLVSSCVLKGFPEVREESVLLCPDGGFEGKISRLAFFNTAITQERAYQIYKAGGTFSNDLISNTPQWLITVMVILVIGLISYSLLL